MAKADKKAKPDSVEAAVQGVQARHGNVVRRYGDEAEKGVDVIPTGSWGLDLALGIGGWPRGRIVEFYGPEMSGKTTLTLHAIANAQRIGGATAFIDAEHALDPRYARNIGVDMKNLIVSQPDCGEQALQITQELAESGQFALLVVDSVAALTPKAEIEGDVGDLHVGGQARMMSQAMRKLTSVLHRTNTTAIFINQLRHKIGVMFGSPETTTGGHALKYYASVRIDIRRRDKLNLEGSVAGNLHHLKVAKNKLAPPFKEVDVNVWYGQGIDRHADLADVALAVGAIQQSGSWFSHAGDGDEAARICQGRFKLNETLRDDEKVRRRIISDCATERDVLRWLE